jgi:hypothetical protein
MDDHDHSINVTSTSAQATDVINGMLTGTIGLIEGARQIVDLRHGLFAHGEIDPDFGVILEFQTKTLHLPVGAVRQYWSAAALAEKDREIAAVEASARPSILAACQALLARLTSA